MSPLAQYLLVLTAAEVALWVAYLLVLRAAGQRYELAATVAVAAAFVGARARGGSPWDLPVRQDARAVIDHYDRAVELERVAGWCRAGAFVLSAIVLVVAAVVLLP